MYETIYTKYGHVQLGNEFIHIEDDQYRRDMRWTSLVGLTGFLLAVINLYKEWPDIYEGLSIVYVAIFIVSLISLPFLFLLTYQKTVSVEEVKSIKLKSNLSGPYLAIRLRNGRVRRILGLKGALSDVRAYISANFPA